MNNPDNYRIVLYMNKIIKLNLPNSELIVD